MFDKLTEHLERGFKILKGQGRITEINISESLKEIRRALVEADVNYKIAKTFVDEVKEKALGQNVLTAIKPGELMVKIVHDEMSKLMGGDAAPLHIDGRPAIILMSGLQGSGKTTFTAKLANKLKNEKGKRPLLAACDVYRPAAIDQLKALAENIGVPVYSEEGSKDPVSIAKHAIEQARRDGNDLVIIDTAGRLAVDEAMMTEIADIKKAVKPSETLFVVDAMTGQDAVNTAKAFNDRLDFDGVVLTKLDGDAKAGAALTIRSVVTKPIKFIGTSEKMDGIDTFHPDRMANRILGMGDIVSLVEKAQQVFDEKQAAEIERKMLKNKFDFNDFRDQLKQIKKMGDLKSVASMIPGVGKAIKDMDIDENIFKSTEAVIDSMTPYERAHPDCINESRRRRLAAGSGVPYQEVNGILKRFNDMRKMMQTVANMRKNPLKMAQQMRQMQQMAKQRR
ncbi:MAG: signal recognition particle protein [Bacteroidales bacterium]|nr:signal recognition particle protein [Bacteroidales bacterium]MDD6959830.1 signal recognition particle protein [Bacteroidales bacterium]MDY6186653.1 signal recognition particle protein [Muribaculaceae bacterium]